MAWDSCRPVPWKRLIRDWLLYLAIMMVVFVVVLRDRMSAGTTAGLLVSGPLFVILGAVLAKFGYTRRTMKELRAQSQAQAAQRAQQPVGSAAGPRAKPAPTKRTSSGAGGRPGSKRKR